MAIADPQNGEGHCHGRTHRRHFGNVDEMTESMFEALVWDVKRAALCEFYVWTFRAFGCSLGLCQQSKED